MADSGVLLDVGRYLEIVKWSFGVLVHKQNVARLEFDNAELFDRSSFAHSKFILFIYFLLILIGFKNTKDYNLRPAYLVNVIVQILSSGLLSHFLC